MAELSLDNSLLLKQLIPVLEENTLANLSENNKLPFLTINSFWKQEMNEEKIMVLLSPFLIPSLC